MWKKIAVLTALVLWLGTSAPASIIVQDQGMVIGTNNAINLLQGDENGSSSQTLILSITQEGSGIGSLLGSVHQIGVTTPFGGLSGLTAMTGLGQSLMVSGLVSPWTLNSLSDQARLHALMLSAN